MINNLSDFEDTEIEEDDTDTDIVIIGAGLSGLTAADRLISAGLNILILEQTGYTGGRLLTLKKSRSFYAHKLQNRLNEMVQYLNLSKEKEKFPNKRKILHFDKNKNISDNIPFYNPGEVYFFIKLIDSISKNAYFKTYRKEILNEELSNVSIEDLLCRLVFFQKSRSLCRNLIYATCGIAQLKNVSALWYIVMLNGAGGFIQRLRVTLGDSNRYFIQGGAMNIARLLTKNINKENQIHCHESVNKIQFNNDRAYIWTNKGHYKCDYVILAVPPLESSKITVEPHLPLNITKAQSSYDKETNVFFNAKSSQLIESNNLTKNIIGITNYNMNLRLAYDATINKDNEFHVSGFLSKTNINSDMKMNLLSILNKCFTSNIELEDLTETSWRLIPGGSPMNVPKPGCLKHHLNLLSESHGRIFFAVSEYAKNWPGTIDGAIEAGKSVAYSILERVRPQSMSSLEWKLHKLAIYF